MALGYSASVSETSKFGDQKTDNTSSGQHGQLVNFATGHGTSLTPTNSDATGGVQTWVWLLAGGMAAGVVVWLILRKR